MKILMILLLSLIADMSAVAQTSHKNYESWKSALLKKGFTFSDTNEEAKVNAAYAAFPERWAAAFDFILNTDLDTISNGTYDLKEKETYVTISEYLPKSEETGNIESHEVYTDIQMVIQQEEKMGLVLDSNYEVTRPYNKDRDVAFYKALNIQYYVAPPKKIFIFMPNEIHQPGVLHETNQLVKKMVIKIKN